MATPLRVSLATVGLNAVLNILAVWLLPVEWRHVGLAASTVVCAAAGCALLAALARRRNGTLGLAQVAKPIATILGASVAMGVAVSAARPLVSSLPPIAALAALILLGAAVYGILSLVLLRDQLKKTIRMS
jgi:peptidoglycan biosynthesis protein MviN/MurJ (putative lipid II flippase)